MGVSSDVARKLAVVMAAPGATEHVPKVVSVLVPGYREEMDKFKKQWIRSTRIAEKIGMVLSLVYIGWCLAFLFIFAAALFGEASGGGATQLAEFTVACTLQTLQSLVLFPLFGAVVIACIIRLSANVRIFDMFLNLNPETVNFAAVDPYTYNKALTQGADSKLDEQSLAGSVRAGALVELPDSLDLELRQCATGLSNLEGQSIGMHELTKHQRALVGGAGEMRKQSAYSIGPQRTAAGSFVE
eukprot:GDKI01016210.1.p1 GENE.GDKI01016210.1~~GDKI01016210.1.p1  ORF type:complete len:271 (+),score=85.06 GDKI01016210.1:86-814(+)